MQESHLIRLSTGQLLPNNLQASDKNNIGLYVGLGWFITTNFGHEVIWHNGATVGGYNAYTAFNPTTERVLSYYVVPTLRILILQQLVSVRMINYHL